MVYNIYAIKIPTKNGAIIFKKFPIVPVTAVKLSKHLNIIINAKPNKNQYPHFFIAALSVFIFTPPFYVA